MNAPAFLLLPVKCTSKFQKRRPHRWHGVGTDMWHKKDGQACRLTIFRKVLSCGINGHTAPLISQESSTKKETFGL